MRDCYVFTSFNTQKHKQKSLRTVLNYRHLRTKCSPQGFVLNCPPSLFSLRMTQEAQKCTKIYSFIYRNLYWIVYGEIEESQLIGSRLFLINFN